MKRTFFYLIIASILSLLLITPARLSDAQGVGNVVGIAVSEDGRTQWDYARGDSTYGLDVDITRMPASGGNNFYAIKRDNITNGASVNIPFGFTSNTVIVETPGSNTTDIVIDWAGATAVAPAANTAGDDIIPPGRTVVLDWFNGTSVSVIATTAAAQTVYIRAFN